MTLDTKKLKQQLESAIEQHQAGQIQEAMVIYQTLLKQFPGHPKIFYLSGLAHQDLGDFQGAMERISRAITLEPENGTFHYALGILLKKMGHARAALERFRDARQREPHHTDVHFHLGDTHMDLGEAQEAQHHFRTAIQLRPLFKEAWVNLGLCLKACKQLDEALACFQQVARDHPQSAEGHINLGLTHLLMGEYALGWQAYEWRFQLQTEEVYTSVPTLTKGGQATPRWDGSSLQGKTILILSEQGFGDTLQFARYLVPLKAAGARILLTSPGPLISLLRTLPTIDQVLPPPRLGIQAFLAQVQEPVDWFCPLLSLPLILGTRVDSIPAHVPYIYPDPERVQQWTERLQKGPSIPFQLPSHSTVEPFRVGLVWQGKPLHENDPLRRRSCTLKDLAPLANEVEGLEGRVQVALFSLQKWEGPLKPLQPPEGMEITDLQAELSDFAQTAAILKALDLLITIDTSVAHLGGALGMPVWVLLPFAPDWRWFLDQGTTPWYPTVRLFRQTVPNCWKEPVEEVRAALPMFIEETLVLRRTEA